jgi:LPS-assembly protein
MVRTASAILLLVAALLLAGARLGEAQAPVTVETAAGPVTVLADRIEEFGADNLVVATGNVEVIRGATRLTADRVEINRQTGDAVAQGRAIFYDGDDRLAGDRIDYNINTGTGVVYQGQARVAPYYRIGGERMERLGESVYRVRTGVFTTCEDDPPTWSFRFGAADADLQELIYGTNGSFWIKNVPIVPFVPIFAAAVRRERQTGFLFPRFGNTTRRGFFFEQPFFWAISDSQDLTLTPVIYQKRGAGSYLEFNNVFSGTHRLSLSGFFIRERDKTKAVRDAVSGVDLDPTDRSRGFWGYKQSWLLAPDLTLKTDINGLSDDTVLRDYGDRLHDRSAQRIESNVFLTRRWPHANLLVNTFWYQDLTQRRPVELQKLPEVRFRMPRQPVPLAGFPGFLYEIDTQFVNFVRDVGSDGTRIDVFPRLSRPVPVLDYVTVTPFAGYRVTAYDTSVIGNRLTRDGGLLVEVTSDDSLLRRATVLGTDVESRLSRVFATGGTGGVDALLHAIEPRVNYTFVGGSRLATRHIPQFDTVDDFPETSLLTYSLTNRVSARSVAPAGTEPIRWEALRFVLAHSYKFDAEERPLGNVTADLLISPNRVVAFRGDTSYNPYGEGFVTGNTDLSVNVPRFSMALGTRYTKPNHFVQSNVRGEVTRNLIARASTNWDLRSNTFVENRVALDIRFQCWAITVEYVDRNKNEDEIRFAVNLLGLGAPLTTTAGLGPLLPGLAQPPVPAPPAPR